jgi:hypothetical protein
MGAAVEDIDGDGDLDIYNSSTGRDFLFLQEGQGEMKENALALGIHHGMGDETIRIQWSPSIADLNGDGLLDVFVRHDHLLVFGAPANNLINTEPQVSSPQASLLYEQQPDGSFLRRSVPFDPLEYSSGVDATLGDVDRDGRLDVAMGAIRNGDYITVKTKAFLWTNQTPEPDAAHALMVALKGTVSADPPMGASVSATCAEVTQVRHLITGGNVGGLPASTLHFAWPACDGKVSLDVHWPSGVRSSHALEEGQRSVNLEEPPWWEVQETEDGWVLRLHPEWLGDEPACVLHAGTDTWECCTESCEKNVDPLTGPYRQARVGEKGVPMALPITSSAMVLRTFPALPTPNQNFTIDLQRRHPLPGVAEEDIPWVRVEGAKLPWDVSDHATGSYQTTTQGAPPSSDLNLKLFLGNESVASMLIPSGYGLDPRFAEFVLYPTQDPATLGMWRLIFTPSQPIDIIDKKIFKAQLSDGTPIPSQIIPSGTGRLALEVSWESVEEGKGLVLLDKDIVRSEPFEAIPMIDKNDVIDRLNSVRGYLSRTDLVEGGDGAILYLTLLDAQGRPLPANPQAIQLETDGLTVVTQPVQMEGTMWSWDLQASVRSLPGVGKGTVRALNLEGDILGEWHVEKRMALNLPYSAEESSISLSHDSLPAGVGATGKLHIHARNQWREHLGLDTRVRVEASDAINVLPPVVEGDGHVSVTIEAGYFGGQWPIDVYLNDTYFDSLTLEVVGPELPQDKPSVTWPQDVDSPDDSGSNVIESPSPPSSTGCSSHTALPAWPWSFFILFMLAGLRRGRKTYL